MQLETELGIHDRDAEIKRLRAALEKGIRLYETYGLVAQSSECGEWINTARAALEK